MRIKNLTIGELATNCYLVWDKENNLAIIDPGGEPELILEIIMRHNLLPKYIFATHGHFDHLLAAWEIQLSFNIPFVVHPKDKKLVETAASSAEYWLKKNINTKTPSNIFYTKQRDTFGFEDFQLLIIETPGHTPGGISLYEKSNGALFSGDVIFKDGVGRTDFSYSNQKLLQKSIGKILSLPKKTRVFPGHGHSTTIASLRIKNLSKHF